MSKTAKTAKKVKETTVAPVLEEAIIEDVIIDEVIPELELGLPVVAEVTPVLLDDAKTEQLKALLNDSEVDVTAILKEFGFITTTTKKKDTGPSKAELSRQILDREYAKATPLPRKDLIALLISEAGCTKAGAGTYLQKYRDDHGWVVHKAA